MPSENNPDLDEPAVDAEVEVCNEAHLDDLDPQTKAVLTTFSTIRSKIDDLARAESDVKRFELSIEQERKRLQKTLEAAKASLRNARIQMGAELAKIDPSGFAQISELVKNREGLSA